MRTLFNAKTRRSESATEAMLWNLSVHTTLEAEDAVAELFHAAFGQPAVSCTHVKTGAVTVSVLLNRPPDLWRATLRQGMAGIKRCGLKIGTARASLRRLRRENWAESWKRHFKPISIGARLLIKPGWSRRRPMPGQAVVILDPGLSFGTGQHPTTGFCLRQLTRRRQAGRAQALLDIGTGSGILAIAAAKLGYQPIHAFDFDADAVRIARSNLRRNRVSNRVRLRRADLTRLPARSQWQYDVVCANLVADLLLSQRERIILTLKPQGILILAGILKTEFAGVRRAFERAGLRCVAGRTEREWRSGAFIRPAARKENIK